MALRTGTLLAAAWLASLGAASVNRACSDAASHVLPFCNTSLSIDERVADLVARIDPAESGALLTARHSAPVSRLGLPAYDWGVNSIHGDQVSCGTNCATNYPLPNAIGASFNASLVRSLAWPHGHWGTIPMRTICHSLAVHICYS